MSLLTLDFCVVRKAGDVNKSGICATAGTIASQWLINFIWSRVKAQVAHRFLFAGRKRGCGPLIHESIVISIFKIDEHFICAYRVTAASTIYWLYSGVEA
jgi:hypothetical protein